LLTIYNGDEIQAPVSVAEDGVHCGVTDVAIWNKERGREGGREGKKMRMK